MRPSYLLAASLLAFGLLLAAARGEEPGPRKRKVKLDRAFYEAHIVPIVQGICAECHADPSRTLGSHRLRPPLGEEVRAKHVRQNFKTVSKLIRPGKPHRSPWLLKPLGPHQGGLEHGGGRRIEKDGPEHRAMLAFVNGAKFEDPVDVPPEPPAPPPVVVHALAAGRPTTHEAFAFTLEGDVSSIVNDDGTTLLRAGAGGGRAALHVDANADRSWLLTLHVIGPGRGLGWRLDDSPWIALDEVADGEHRVGTNVVFDGTGPVGAPSGTLRVESGRLHMRGDDRAPAAWLASEGVPPSRLEARVRLPETAEGGRDALLLFAMADVAEGHFVGLTEGGRWFVAGRLERGRPLVLASARVSTPKGEGPAGSMRHVGVRFTEDGALGTLEGEATVFVHLPGGALSGRRFGLFTRGRLIVDGLSAYARVGEAETAAYDARFDARPVVRIPTGRHAIHLALPATAPKVRSVRLEPLDDPPGR